MDEPVSGKRYRAKLTAMIQETMLSEFLRHLGVERELSPRTSEAYRYQLRGYLRFLETQGRTAISIKQSDVLAYLERRLSGD